MVGSKCQVHTERSLTIIPTCRRPGSTSTSTNTKLTYNLFNPSPSVRAEDQLSLLLLLQVPKVVLVHHPVGPLLVEVLVGVQHQNLFAARLPAVDHHRQGIAGLVPHHMHVALRLYLATRPCAPFERPWSCAGRNASLGHSV